MIKVSLLDGRACLGGWRYGMVPRFSSEYSQRSRRSSVVERALGKGEVGSSILPGGTISRFPSARYRRRIDDPPQAIAEIGLAGRRSPQAIKCNVADRTIRQRQADDQHRVPPPAVGLPGDAEPQPHG